MLDLIRTCWDFGLNANVSGITFIQMPNTIFKVDIGLQTSSQLLSGTAS